MRDGEDWQRLGDYVVARRTHLGMSSQPALSEAIGPHGVSTRTISQLETGHSVRASTVAKIEAALGWKPGSGRRILAGGEPQLINPEPAQDLRPQVVRDNWDDPQVQQLWALENIPPHAKAGLISDYLRARQRAADPGDLPEPRQLRRAR